jgi:hypothetical protein
MILYVNLFKRHFIAGPQLFLHPAGVYIDITENDLGDLLLFNEVPGDPLTHTPCSTYD